MKALTLWQPWATLIAVGEKRIETRSWSTDYRGPLAIHAAKTRNAGTPYEVRKVAAKYGIVYGAVLATCRLVDVIPTARRYRDPPDETPIFSDGRGPIPMAERLLGDFSLGRYAWLLADVKAIEPVPAVGHQRLWEWTP